MNPFESSFFGQHKDVSSVPMPETDNYEIKYTSRVPEKSNPAQQAAAGPAQPPASDRREAPADKRLEERYVPPPGVDLQQICTPEQLSKQHFVAILFNVACVTTTTVIPVEVAAVRFALGPGGRERRRVLGEGYYHSIIEWSLNGRDNEEAISRNFMTIYWNKTHVHGIPNTGVVSKTRKYTMESVWGDLKRFIVPGDVLVGKQPSVTYRCLEKLSSKDYGIPMVRPVEDVIDCICSAFGIQECDEYLDRIDNVPVLPQDVDKMCGFHKSISSKGEYRCVLADAFRLVDIIEEFFYKVSEEALPNADHYHPQKQI